MSDSPKRPRPRPRPRPRNAASSTEIDKPGSSSKLPPVDEDDLFFRNRNRNASGWKVLNKAVEKHEADRAQSQVLSSSDSDSDSPRTKRARRRPKELPAWAKSDGLIQIKDSGSEKSDNKSDSSIILPETTKDRNSRDRTPQIKHKHKRRQSRSSSDSLEPEILYAEQAGRERARQILDSRPVQQENSFINVSDNDDEADDVGDLPAELVAIKAEMKKNLARTSSVDNVTSSQSTIEVTIILRPHPEDETGRSHVYPHTMRRNEKFEQLFVGIADEAGIPSERLVVLHNNIRVYPWSTPHTLSIWSEAELVAYEEHVYKYVKEHEHAVPLNDTQAGAPLDSSTFAVGDYGGATSPEPSQDKSDSFKLQARLGETTITIGVRPTTKCGTIVERVLQKMGKSAAASEKARIVVDGEKLDPESEIGEAELEDGDLIDIIDA